MYNIIKWYNQNRRKFWWTLIFAIIMIALGYYLLNNLGKKNIYDESNPKGKEINTNSFESISMQSQRSVITGKTTSIDQKEVDIIDRFITYCNSQKTSEAYKLLSDECKSIMYPEEKDFIEKYYKPVFGKGRRNVEVEVWLGNIFKVNFKEDIIQTGKTSDDNTVVDYISTVSNNGETKININKYVRTETISKSKTEKNVTIKAVRKEIYMDYEIYTFEIKNESNKEISLGDVKYSDAFYLKDDNNLQYNAYVTEISPIEVTCESGETKNVRIKYFNRFSSTRKITKAVFPKIILYNELYNTMSNKDKYINYVQISIDL